jgi:FkbM family methyltransferase
MKLGSPSLVFAGCARDCEPFLEGVLENIERFGTGFESTGYVFVENDSTDGTQAILQRWIAGRANARLLTGEVADVQQSPRTARIANARNAYMDFIAASDLRTFDYLVVIDLDDVNAAEMSGEVFRTAVSYLEAHRDHVGLFACSNPVYYDVWALRHPTWCPNDVWAEVGACKELPYAQAVERFVYSRQLSIPANSEPIPVQSAFGGLAIYRLNAVLASRYVGSTAVGTECCEHVMFNATAATQGRLVIFPPLRNQAPSAHIRPASVGAAENARMMRIVQDGQAAELIAPIDHPLDRYRAAFPMYDRWLPRLARIVSNASPEESMIDVGANIGDTVAACRLAGCIAPFIAVEPSARYFAFLQSNIARNRALFGNVRVINSFVGPRGIALSLNEANGTAVSAPSVTGAGSAATQTLSELATGPVSLLKTDTDGFDAAILLDGAEFLRSARPVVWAEAEVPTRQHINEWAEVLASIGSSHQLVCAFDNFGFPIVNGLLRDKRPIILDLLDYIRRHRSARQEDAGEPRIYYLDMAFFPERFQKSYEEFCAAISR